MEKKHYIQPETEVIVVPYRVMESEWSDPQGGTEEGNTDDNWARHHSSWNESEEEESMWFHSSNLWE